ncbi:hypothetical protein [Dissulfurimicrobium hydrothermale]|uniref:hypothetical protein n=1 Tax=Dissulfurimicrobium hydrothermale TaxID=1750598 RepID=UPI001ED9EEE5|nr:hypothetical protein [Dissulfurimicrobium hydrothermale]UKL13777.1 hypothetical protein LGS26_00385 [Dissulfurimicrobium hydrothermale]
MKKIFSLSLSLVAALMLAMWSSQAGAITLGEYAPGQLVPFVVQGDNIDTVVGLTCKNTSGCTVYWTFFDVNSNHVTDSQFKISANGFYPFSWKKYSGVGLANTRGYLVFSSGSLATTSTTSDIAANAFLVDTTAKDAVFVPVLPLAGTDYAAGTDLTKMTSTSIISAVAATAPGKTLDVRYWIDPAYSATTTVEFWSVCDITGNQTVDIFDDQENRQSVNIPFANAELNTIDPSTIVGRPASFVDGFIRFVVPAPATCATGETNDMLVFSYVDSHLIGATQTMLAGEQN